MSICPYVCTCVRTSVRPQKVALISMKFDMLVEVDEWCTVQRYAVWPDPRSRSQALKSWKSGRSQKLSPPPFTMAANNWLRILKLGHNIWISLGQIFYIQPNFCVAWLSTWQIRQLWSWPSVPYGANLLSFVQKNCN